MALALMLLYSAKGITAEGRFRMNAAKFAAVFLLLAYSTGIQAQQAESSTRLTRPNTFSVFTEYSNDSSHILLGIARDRKLATLGIAYTRLLVLNRRVSLQYLAEFRPIIMERDPLANSIVTQTLTPPGEVNVYKMSSRTTHPCKPSTQTFTFVIPGSGVTDTTTNVTTCSNQWSFAQAFSPFGFKVNLAPARRIQPFLTVQAGSMLSAQKLPVDYAGSFNFIFGFGAGLELFKRPGRSLAFEYRYQHYSNKNTASQNPGVDSTLFHVAYSFGR